MASGFDRQVRVRDEYQRRNPEWVDSVRRYRALIEAASAPGARLLDLGCGRNGLHGDDLSCAPDAVVFGVDPDPAALADNRVIRHRVVGSGEELPFASGTFDVVASAWVLEHLDHPGLVFSEVRRVLVTGGRFVFLTPNAWNYNAWMIRAIPHRWHAGLTQRLYGRGEGDAPRPLSSQQRRTAAPAAQRRRLRAHASRLQRRPVIHRLQQAAARVVVRHRADPRRTAIAEGTGAHPRRRRSLTADPATKLLRVSIDMTTEQREIVGMVRDFVEREIIPVAHDLDHDDVYPDRIVAQMKQLGFFGFAIGEEYGGTGLDYATYAMVCEEIARGWMSITGIINTHFIVAFLIENFGTDEQKQRFLPRMATGEFHGGFSMSEPNCGSDVQAIQTRAIRDNGEYVINGTKMWATNGEHSTVVATLVKTDPDASPPHRGMSCILAEKQYQGFTSSRRIEKLGYKGVETTELVFENNRQPASNLLGGVEGQGFKQMMAAIEVGRVNVAARGVGVAQRAFELSIAYAQQRQAFGVAIAQHEAIQFKLADMATKIQAARLLTNFAARKKDAGERADVECGMAKLFASETCFEVVSEALRVHGGYGFSKEYDVERLYRDAPLLIIGEGTNEIQRLIIAKGLLERHRITT